MMPMPSERDYLFFLLSKQDYSKAQLQQKLLKRAKLTDVEIVQLLDEFAQKGWQSDQRFAEQLIRASLLKGYGEKRIIQKLVYEKQVDASLVERLLCTQEIDWTTQAKMCYQKKYHDDVSTHIDHA